jgi:hypothetical protein
LPTVPGLTHSGGRNQFPVLHGSYQVIPDLASLLRSLPVWLL